MSNVSFAEDVLTEILSRLRVKSLFRFRCVCKEWHRLIQSPAFVSKHFNRETNHSCLLVEYVSPGFRPRPHHFALFPDKDLNGTPPVHEDIYIYEQLWNIGEIFGPVNGLFFVHIKHFGADDDMALWNPATRKLKLISYPKLEIPSHWELHLEQFGFGIDNLSNDYKIIWFRSYYDREDDVYPCGDTEITIYSLSKDSWSSPVTTDSSPSNSLDYCSHEQWSFYIWIMQGGKLLDQTFINWTF